MKHVTIKAPAELHNQIEARAKELGYKTVSRYILALVLSDLWAWVQRRFR